MPHGCSGWASYQIRKIACCACAGNAGNVFPATDFKGMPLVRDPGVHHGTCVTHLPWCMSGSQTGGGGENVPGIPGACATRNFTYLARDPLVRFIAVSIMTSQVGSISTVSSTAYSVHKKYGNSNSYVNFNTNISIIHHFIYTANWKYHFPSPYQISDTFVEYFGNYGP